MFGEWRGQSHYVGLVLLRPEQVDYVAKRIKSILVKAES